MFVIFGFVLAIILISVFWKQKKIVLIGFCLIFLIFGIWTHRTAELRIINSALKQYNNLENSVVLTGTIIKEPDIRENSIQVVLKVDSINNIDLSSNRVGNILIFASRYPEYKYGDKLKVIGRLENPPVFETFNYRDFLSKKEIYSIVRGPKIELLDQDSQKTTILIRGKILDFKTKLREVIYSNLSPPQSSILGAMLLGDKSRISDKLKNKLNIVGLRHITCVSGMHIAILTAILMSFLIGLGLWRQHAFYITVILMVLFITMIGFQASAIRAGIMGLLFLAGQNFGRKSFSPRAIVMAAAIMLAINPLLLLNDIGFQLSFLAVIGIIYFLPVFQKWFRKIPNIFQFRNILAMTLSAQIFTLPILIYNFGYFSLISPISNVLIVPFLPYIIGSGFLFALTGIFSQTLGWILSLPCWFLLTYLVKILNFLSQEWAIKVIENVHWIWLMLSYLVLGIIVWRISKNREADFLNY
ncbi:MAG: ComEC/Rec2 family competence protein [Patescibacteria group bacterium]|nr:ComEC/Rec2 family competence protein [Patescibacteria group bacterium]